MRFVKVMVNMIQNAEKSDSSICFYPIFGILIVSFYLSVFSALACTLHLRTTIQLCLICTTILFIRPPSNTPIKLPLFSFARFISSKALPSTKKLLVYLVRNGVQHAHRKCPKKFKFKFKLTLAEKKRHKHSEQKKQRKMCNAAHRFI